MDWSKFRHWCNEDGGFIVVIYGAPVVVGAVVYALSWLFY